MRTTISLAALVLALATFAGCADLDMNLLDPGDAISEYKFSAYTGRVDFRLDSSYTIDPANIHLLKLPSKSDAESGSTQIYAVYIGDTSRIAEDTVILYLHGFNHHMDFYYPRAQLLANVGWKHRYGVMMIDYRGYGLSSGEPSEEGLYADADAALQWLKSRGLTSDRLVNYGFSLGCAPAIYLTAHPRALRPQKLITESPFASPANLTQDALLLNVPGSFVSTLKLDNVKEIRSVEQPFFWMHGTDDEFININTNGAIVFKNYQGVYGEAHPIAGADHSTVPQTWGFRNYTDSLLRFLTRP